MNSRIQNLREKNHRIIKEFSQLKETKKELSDHKKNELSEYKEKNL